MIYLRFLSLLALLCSLAMPLAAQSRYRPGYFKDRQGHRVAAQLAYGDYLDSHFLLRYRLKGVPFTVSSDSLSEAGFGQTPFFIQLPALTDLSSLGGYTDTTTQTLRLRVEGQSATASLYSYREGGSTHYALRSGKGPVLRLIQDGELFTQQLQEQLPQEFSRPLKYRRSTLRSYVEQYVQGKGDSLQVPLPRPLKGLPWVLWVSPGMLLEEPSGFPLRLGMEADLFPAGNRHWALSMRLGAQTLYGPTVVDWRADPMFNAGLGVRYYQHADVVEGTFILQGYVESGYLGKDLDASESVRRTYMHDYRSSLVFGGGIGLRHGRFLFGLDLRAAERNTADTLHGLFYLSWAVADRSRGGEGR